MVGIQQFYQDILNLHPILYATTRKSYHILEGVTVMMIALMVVMRIIAVIP